MDTQSIAVENLFSNIPEAFKPLFAVKQPWDILAKLDDFLATIMDNRQGDIHPTAVIDGPLHLAKGASIGPHVYIDGPAWIGEGATVKHAAYFRKGVVLAAGAEIGAKTEIKHSLFLPGAKAAHLNYVGDSVIGADVNIGAGVKLANFKADGSFIRVEDIETGLRKFGSIVGDDVSVGCNAVLTPGTVVGANTIIYNCAVLRGVVPSNSIVKLRQRLEIVERR